MAGGFLVAAGSSGMVQATSDKSTQAGVLMTYTKMGRVEAECRLKVAEDNARNEQGSNSDWLVFTKRDVAA